MQNDIIKFIRRRDYQLVKELGQGACGRTVLLFDEFINEQFVCKKFTPYLEENRPQLFANFIRETKILHQVHHENVVRVFNYYLYPDVYSGYILMEYVDGSDIEDFLSSSPELINELFLQTVDGFSYLESKGILHRDIRPQNLLVSDKGILKIIDFGFGKQVQQADDFDKSVSLNWWCELPAEFADATYDYSTEVYFVGKLFERIIKDNSLDNFKYSELLKKMCQRNPENRVSSFSYVQKQVQEDQFFEIDFSYDETSAYRNFSNALKDQIGKIESGTKYFDDISRFQTDLESAYRSFMLEDTIPDCAIITRCMIRGGYTYRKDGFSVWVVKDFLHILKSLSPEKKRIVISNLHTCLDAMPRYEKPEFDDDVPF